MGSLRQWARKRDVATASIAMVAASGLVALAVGWLTGSRAASADDRPGWTTFDDPQHGFTVQFPSTWHRARSPLVPKLISPGEILSIGTGPLKVGGGGNCGLYPVKAMAAMEPTDVLISLKEWKLGAGEHFVRSTPPRPTHFRLGLRPTIRPVRSVRPILQGVVERSIWTEFEFRDRGRVFRAFVAIGRAASHNDRRAVLTTLDSLHFERTKG